MEKGEAWKRYSLQGAYFFGYGYPKRRTHNMLQYRLYIFVEENLVDANINSHHCENRHRGDF